MSILSWQDFVRQQRGEYELSIAPSDLRLGDYVVRAERIHSEWKFPANGFRIDSFDQKQTLKEHCRRVTIDLSRSLNRRDHQPESSDKAVLPALPATIDRLRGRALSARGVVQAWQVYRELSLAAQGMILSFGRHGQVDIEGCKRAIEGLVTALDEHLPELIWLTHLKEHSRYSYQHGLNVAILMAAFCHSAGWSRTLVEQAALAGLFHDLGKTRLKLATLARPGPLNEEEWQQVRQHSRFAHDLLVQNSEVPVSVVAAVLGHGERVDGQGYPMGQSGDDIPGLARLVAIVAAFDAMTSRRPHQPPRSHQDALGELWRERGKQFDKALVEGFSSFLGWAPPGTLMQLGDGSPAVALHTETGQTRPRVRRLVKAADQWQFGVELNLAGAAGKDNPALTVKRLLPDGAGGISLRELTRRLPRALTAGGDASMVSHAAKAPVRRERRRRPRIDAPRGSRILVVDDSNTIRQSLIRMLQQAGYEMDQADSGEKGLEQAFLHPPDLIFLDIVLPEMSGFGALRRLRKDELTRDIPVVMISGNARAADQFFLQRVGADDFIYKPFGRFEVFSCIERLVRSGSLPLRDGQQLDARQA
ncbi:MAG: HD domain-containing phosphohydrolase [Wenzhouxiangella sp.]